MPDEFDKKEWEYSPQKIMPVARSTANATIVAGGDTRAHPIHRTEFGVEMQCMSCGYQCPESIFYSENKLSFKGCPTCGNIDKSKFIAFDEDGLMVNKSRTNPENYVEEKFVGQEKEYGESRGSTHTDVLSYQKLFKKFFK